MKTQRVAGTALRLGLGAMAAVAFLANAPSAAAQWTAQQQQGGAYPNRNGGQQMLFEWSGRVDKEIWIQMRGNQARVNLVGNKEANTGRLRSVGVLQQGTGAVTVQTLSGRGQVDVMQQPNASNGYTTTIRIRDPEAGQGTYRVRAYTTYTYNTPNGRNSRDRRNRD